MALPDESKMLKSEYSDVYADEDAAALDAKMNGKNGIPRVTVARTTTPDERDVENEPDDDEAGNDDDWAEIDSIYEDTLAEMGDEHLFEGDPDTCSLQEAIAFRQQLRLIGPAEFCRKTVEAGTITAKKLITAFGIKPPEWMDGLPDEEFYTLLSVGLSRELSKRIKLSKYNTIDDAVELLQRSKNIIVLTGAGISTSLGIPDFRSKDTGLYSKLEYLGLSDPQEVFDIHMFREDPTIFYSIAKDIIPATDRFTPTHAFIHLLQQKGKLLTNYSQNIDNIESIAGILPEKLIQCHGSFATASCVECKHKVPGETIFPDIKNGLIPVCPICDARLKARPPLKRKRSQNGQDKKRRRFDENADSSEDEGYDLPQPGIMKPDITFFGEQLPDTFSERLTNVDKFKVDLVIVIGTSLKVAPVSEVVPYLPAHIPQIYISKTPVSHVNFDIDMLGECDVVVAELCRRAGWNLEHEMIPKNQQLDIKLQEGFTSRHVFTTVKEATD